MTELQQKMIGKGESYYGLFLIIGSRADGNLKTLSHFYSAFADAEREFDKCKKVLGTIADLSEVDIVSVRLEKYPAPDSQFGGAMDFREGRGLIMSGKMRTYKR